MAQELRMEISRTAAGAVQIIPGDGPRAIVWRDVLAQALRRLGEAEPEREVIGVRLAVCVEDCTEHTLRVGGEYVPAWTRGSGQVAVYRGDLLRAVEACAGDWLLLAPVEGALVVSEPCQGFAVLVGAVVRDGASG